MPSVYHFLAQLLFEGRAPDGARLYPDVLGPLRVVIAEEPAFIVAAPNAPYPPAAPAYWGDDAPWLAED